MTSREAASLIIYICGDCIARGSAAHERLRSCINSSIIANSSVIPAENSVSFHRGLHYLQTHPRSEEATKGSLQISKRKNEIAMTVASATAPSARGRAMCSVWKLVAVAAAFILLHSGAAEAQEPHDIHDPLETRAQEDV